MKNVMGLIFTNTHDAALGSLTRKRTQASLPYGGRYRQIDFTLSNMSNAGIRHIGIVTQYNFKSLMNHVGSGEEWDLKLEDSGLEFITPYSMGATNDFRGKLDAIYTARKSHLQRSKEEYIVLADASVICSIDLKDVVNTHINSGKDVTMVVKRGIANGKKPLDLAVQLDAEGEVTDLAADYAAPGDYL
ncbi:MAG: glucose-1-phosphate adenylyltransferase subunit GlgD, partial [Oscillospiraceae bacterium]|nr:glucose-1-phosphate adenylyltransferase subunit GlgD [Oscillospiraceae bacterium]